MMRTLYVFVSLIYLLSSFILSSVSCAGSSPTRVDPNTPGIPRTRDFDECSYSERSCDGLYYCGNGAPCSLQKCTNHPDDPGTLVPLCDTAYHVSLTAAIVSRESPIDVMRSTAYACEVYKQMVILSSVRSSKSAADIVNTMAPWSNWKLYTAYDIELGFFYEADPDKPALAAVGLFYNKLKFDSSALLDSHTTSLDTPAGILLNTSNIQITPATFAIRRCSDGTAVTGSETCPPIDPALVPNNAASSSTKTTTQLLTIILPIVGGVVFCALIITALVIVRRRQANKVMRQTIRHTEPAVEVTMA